MALHSILESHAKIKAGDSYKFHIASRLHGYQVDKADPFAVHAETSPKTASKVWDLAYTWNDAEWMSTRASRNSTRAPMSTYEVHLGSWRRIPEEGNRSLSYREIAQRLESTEIKSPSGKVKWYGCTVRSILLRNR